MGLFDYLTCKYPLPVPGANDLEFQTKDTPEQYMGRYEIRADGSLWHQTARTEDRSDPTAPEGSFARLRGCMTRVPTGWEPQPHFTGEIRFGRWSKEDGALTFSAYFVRGQLRQLEVIEQ